FAEASSWQMESLAALGRMDEARAIGEEAAKVASRVLERRPGHMPALRAHALLVGSLGGIEGDALRYKHAIALAREGEADWLAYTRLDPGNAIAWNNLTSTRAGIAVTLEQAGRIEESLAVYRQALKTVPMESPGLAANF